MKRISLIFLVSVSFGFLIITGCHKDDNSKPQTISNTDFEINNFIWGGLHSYYLWTASVPKLTTSYFHNDTSELYPFLRGYTNHDTLFYNLLYQYGTTDKWSWIVSDYTELEKEFEGITKSMGYNFMLARYGTANDVLGYVRYVVKGSPADLAGIKRGYVFTKVNDQQLTIDNYMDLLINSEAYKLSFVDIVDHNLVSNGKTANMTAVEVTEDPIYLDTVYTINNTKVGYLMYNNFVSNYDRELNDVMSKFKTAGVTKLILDLRYNTGGAGTSATYLASMIYGTNTSTIFYKTEYNTELQAYLTQQYGADFFVEKFQQYIVNEDNSQTNIVSLNLPDVYIITTDHTASASELVINGLKPYINVFLLGTTTAGKYVGSITLKDIIDNKGTVNPDHKWAMQPIVMKVTNSAGVTDYKNGFTPNVVLDEEIANMSVLGSLDEPLLAATISNITGLTKKSARQPSTFKVQKLEGFNGNLKKASGLYFKTPEFIKKGLGK